MKDQRGVTMQIGELFRELDTMLWWFGVWGTAWRVIRKFLGR